MNVYECPQHQVNCLAYIKRHLCTHTCMYVYVYEQWNIQETNVALRGLKLAAASSAQCFLFKISGKGHFYSGRHNINHHTIR